MTTATSIITRALRGMGVISATQTPSADDIAAGLESLNDVLAALSLSRGAFPAQTTQVITLTAGDGIYSIGAGADFNVARPLRVESAFITINGMDMQLVVGSRADYDALPEKLDSGQPDRVFYDATSANGDIRFYPVPDDAYSVTLTCWCEFTQLSGIGATVVLPNYLTAYLRVALMVALAPEYSRPVDQMWLAQMDSMERKMLTLHRPMPKAMFDIARPFDIEYD